MTPIDVDEIIERTLQIASSIEGELYQCARHSSKLSVIEELRQWLKLGNKVGSFRGACTVNDGQNGNRNVRELCYEIFNALDHKEELLSKHCLSMEDLVDYERRYAIHFNTDDDKEYELDDHYEDEEGFISNYLDKNGDVIVPFQKVLLSINRNDQAYIPVCYHTFFHALRQYFIDRVRPDLSHKVSQKFGLTDKSEYACDQLSVIPSALDELTTELLFANRQKWREYYEPSLEIIALINDRFHAPNSVKNK